MRYVFDEFELDALKGKLHRAGEPVDLKGLSLSFLTALVKAAPDALSADVLAQQVWGRPSITEDTLKKRVSLVRAAVGADVIRTLPDRTYALSVKVAELEPEPEPRTEPELALGESAESQLQADPGDAARAEPEPVTRAPTYPAAPVRPETAEREGADMSALMRRAMFIGGVFMVLVLVSVVLRGFQGPSEPARLVDPESGAVMDAPRG